MKWFLGAVPLDLKGIVILAESCNRFRIYSVLPINKFTSDYLNNDLTKKKLIHTIQPSWNFFVALAFFVLFESPTRLISRGQIRHRIIVNVSGKSYPFEASPGWRCLYVDTRSATLSGRVPWGSWTWLCNQTCIWFRYIWLVKFILRFVLT